MLQQLAGYATAHLGDSEPGFKSREVRWCIEINSAGSFLNVIPLGDGKRGANTPRTQKVTLVPAGTSVLR